MANYVITSDSTCDLSAEQISSNGIVLKPLCVILGDKDYFDGVNIDSDKILEYVDNGGVLPKTAATSIEEYKDFFKTFTDKGLGVIHFDISSKLSSCNSNALIAAKELKDVYVVDSKHLSSGQGLLVLVGADNLKAGMSIEENYKKCIELADKVQCSFVLDRLDFMHKGGRCSLSQLIGAKMLKLHPYLWMDDGMLKVKKKYMGNLKRGLESYVYDLSQEYPNYNKKRCFVTHCKADEEYVKLVIAKIKELFDFDEIIETKAGATVTSHCGRNTLGVLFIND